MYFLFNSPGKTASVEKYINFEPISEENSKIFFGIVTCKKSASAWFVSQRSTLEWAIVLIITSGETSRISFFNSEIWVETLIFVELIFRSFIELVLYVRCKS